MYQSLTHPRRPRYDQFIWLFSIHLSDTNLLPFLIQPKTGNIAQLSAAQAAQGQSTNNPIDTWLAAALLLDNGSPIDTLEWWIQQKSAGNTHGGLLQMALDVLSCPGMFLHC
jgi:hypothetical protein